MFQQLNKMIWFVGCVLLGTSGVSRALENPNGSTNKSQANAPGFFSKEKWGVEYLNYMNGPTFSDANGGSINHYLTLKHKLNSDWAISLVLRPDSNIGNGGPFLAMDDSYFKLDYPTIYQNDSGIKIRGDIRYFAPFGANSQKAGIAGTLSTRIYASAEIGRLEALYILIPKLFLNTRIADGQAIASHGHWVALAYKMSSFWSLDLAVYPVWTINRNQDVAFNGLPIYPGFTMRFSKALSVSPYVEVPLVNTKSSNTSVGGLLSYAIL